MAHQKSFITGTPIVTLVDQDNNVLGKEDVFSAHLGNARRHRAISVFLFNNNGELLLQQRSNKKMLAELLWANTCCANVAFGESFEQCAHRRLEQELGITRVALKELFTFEYHEKINNQFSEWEIDKIFVGFFNDSALPNPNEVNDIRWIKPEKLLAEIQEQPEQFSVWIKIVAQRKEFLHFLTTLPNI